nr:MAG TPA: hypothetical protein [Caudoviricetes sp.]
MQVGNYIVQIIKKQQKPSLRSCAGLRIVKHQPRAFRQALKRQSKFIHSKSIKQYEGVRVSFRLLVRMRTYARYKTRKSFTLR